MRAAKAELLVAMFAWGMSRKATDVQVMIDTRMLPSFLEMTPAVRPLGLSHPYSGGPTAPGGGETIAIRCPLTKATIDDLKAFGRLVNGIGIYSTDAITPKAA